MKSKLFIFIILLATSLPVCSQKVYDQILKTSIEKVENPQTIPMLRQIEQFKVDALQYMIVKMREHMPDSSAVYLDNQAFALNHFVNLFVKRIVEIKDLPAVRQIKTIKHFMDCSISNPLFNDSDQDLVLCYYNNPQSYTRFSLDTNWIKAINAVNSIKKED